MSAGNGHQRSNKSTDTNPAPSPPAPNLCCRTSTPDDYPHIAAMLDDIRRTHKPVSTRHRIITVQGDVRDVVVIGERCHDSTGEVIGTQGFYLDVTPSAKQRQESITEALAEIAHQRAVIEQAKGVLMYVYGIGPDAAFDVLRRSQDANVKLRALAEQLVARRAHPQARRRLPRVAPAVRPAATHSPPNNQRARSLSAWRPPTRAPLLSARRLLPARVGLTSQRRWVSAGSSRELASRQVQIRAAYLATARVCRRNGNVSPIGNP